MMGAEIDDGKVSRAAVFFLNSGKENRYISAQF